MSCSTYDSPLLTDMSTRLFRSGSHYSRHNQPSRSVMMSNNPFNPIDTLRRKLSNRSSQSSSSQGAQAHGQTECNANLSPRWQPYPGQVANPYPEAPPAYSPAPYAPSSAASTSEKPASSSASSGENDPFHFLRTFDTVFLIDDSGSMSGARWREARDALKTITPICTAYDADGIDIYFLNSKDTAANHNVTSAAAVERIFDRVYPTDVTPTGQRLHDILDPYLTRYKSAPPKSKPKPMNLICITDGVPTDDVDGPLVQAARRLDKMNAPPWQVGIQFFQVGNDRRARDHLQSLDDDLQAAAGGMELRDIIDTVPFKDGTGAGLTGDGILKVVLGGVNRRQDRKNRDTHK